MEELLDWWEKIKKYNHGKKCHKQWKYFSPFVLSVGGMIGREALIVLTNLIQLMAEKMNEPILHVQGWIKSRIAITVARSYSLVICVSKFFVYPHQDSIYFYSNPIKQISNKIP